MERDILFQIKQSAKELFVKNDADLTQDNVIAAITDAARWMALAGETATKDSTQAAVLAAFDASDKKEVAELLEQLDPSFVKAIIGFSTDYKDFGKAYAAYHSSEQQYETLYGAVNKWANSKQANGPEHTM